MKFLVSTEGKGELFDMTLVENKSHLKRPSLKAIVTDIHIKGVTLKSTSSSLKIGDDVSISLRSDGVWKVVGTNDLIVNGKSKNDIIFLDNIVKDHPGFDHEAILKRNNKAKQDMIFKNRVNKYNLSPTEYLGSADGSIKIVVFDLETTGLSPYRDRVIEFAFIDATSSIKDNISSGRSDTEAKGIESYVNPEIPISKSATRINNITDSMVQDQPLFAEFADKITDFIDGAILVGHNVKFDYEFLNSELIRMGREPISNPVICTLEQSRELLGDAMKSFKLGDIANALDFPINNAHSAGEDAVATSKLLAILMFLKHKNHLKKDNVFSTNHTVISIIIIFALFLFIIN